jgi:hypothetical protein
MPNIRIAIPYSLADEFLRPIRKLCDPSRRYSYEAYFRADHIEVRAIDCGPALKTITLTPADAENRIRHD